MRLLRLCDVVAGIWYGIHSRDLLSACVLTGAGLGLVAGIEDHLGRRERRHDTVMRLLATLLGVRRD